MYFLREKKIKVWIVGLFLDCVVRVWEKFLLWMDVCDIFFLVVDGFGYRYIFLFYYDFDKFWKRNCKYLGDVYV